MINLIDLEIEMKRTLNELWIGDCYEIAIDFNPQDRYAEIIVEATYGIQTVTAIGIIPEVNQITFPFAVFGSRIEWLDDPPEKPRERWRMGNLHAAIENRLKSLLKEYTFVRQ